MRIEKHLYDIAATNCSGSISIGNALDHPNSAPARAFLG